VTNEAKIAYETLTRESAVRAYVPASVVGPVLAVGELCRLGLASTAVRDGVLHVIRVRASQSF
jgi:hypothetical protein